MAAFAVTAAVLNVEMDTFLPQSSWLVRMPLVAVFAAQLAKFRGVVLIMSGDPDGGQHATYFFWLYTGLAGMQGLLALWAIFLACPHKQNLELPWGSLVTGYEVRSPLVVSAPGSSTSCNVVLSWPACVQELPSSDLAVPMGWEQETCPEEKANVLSILTFSWLSPLMRKGYEQPLDFRDIWHVAPPDTVDAVHGTFEQHWQKQQTSRASPAVAVVSTSASLLMPRLVCNTCPICFLAAGRPRLFTAAWQTAAHLFLAALPFKLLNDASQFVAPVFINLLLASISGGDPVSHSYGLAGIMFLGLVAGSVCENQYWQRSMRAGFRLRAALVAAVYRCDAASSAGSPPGACVFLRQKDWMASLHVEQQPPLDQSAQH